jgi:hypothetical protein
MDKLKEFYGKELIYVHTVYKNGKIIHNTQSQKVYDPYDLSKRIIPCSGCDMVIGDNSVNSKDIFSIGGVQHIGTPTSFDLFQSLSSFTYCTLEETEKVLELHVKGILEILNDYVEIYSKKVIEVKNSIENIKTEWQQQ